MYSVDTDARNDQDVERNITASAPKLSPSHDSHEYLTRSAEPMLHAVQGRDAGGRGDRVPRGPGHSGEHFCKAPVSLEPTLEFAKTASASCHSNPKKCRHSRSKQQNVIGVGNRRCGNVRREPSSTWSRLAGRCMYLLDNCRVRFMPSSFGGVLMISRYCKWPHSTP